ncbi:MAG: SusC/RagA family TonB-linked outer membrane protein, partial [Muribaculaceae bacterium]|nr:SusC/RagA family TonB-linked outer membrane protein [Muribaculaceae bacterium]
PANVSKAQISYVGFATQTVELHDNMTIYMQSASTALDNVVVVAYGTASKESLTGSVAVVNSDEIASRPVTAVTAAIEGNAPGVQVSNTTGTPGSEPSILIRGINTINGTTAPLYVVDGVIYNGSIADINPADVESMSVLKDAASCALYGAKGANGVILINTKRGKQNGRVDVTVQVNQGMYNRGLPFYSTVSPNQWMELRMQGLVNRDISVRGLDRAAALNNEINGGFFNGATFANTYGLSLDQIFDENGMVRPGVAPLSGYTDTNWWDIVSRHGYRQEYNINATAATDKFSVFGSVGYLKENGYLLKTDFERFTGRFNIDVNPASYFKFGANLYAGYTDSDQPQFSQTNLNTVANPFMNVYLAPFYPYYLHNADGSIIYDADGQPEWNLNQGVGGGLNGRSQTILGNNIGYTLRHDYDGYSALTLDGSIYGTAVIPYGFELTVRGNMYRDRTTSTATMNPNVGSGVSIGGLMEKAWYYTNTYNFMQQLYWSHEYGLNHIDVLLDHENYQYDYGYDYLDKITEIVPDVPELGNYIEEYGNDSYHIQRRTESYLGRVRYNFDQKYFAEASIRRDGTSRFSKDKRWGTFWSVGASWIISKEKFMNDVAWVDNLKLRAAYGSVGNDAAAGSYSYWTLFDKNPYGYGDYPSIFPGQIGAPDVKWESTKTFDLALEGSLFNSRLNFSVGYFLKKTNDLLYNVPLPPSAGGDYSGATWSILSNLGDIQNWGWELAFNGDIIRNKDLIWSASIDATFIKNKVLKLPNGNQWGTGSSYGLVEGKSRYEFYLPTYAGVDQMTGRALFEINRDSHRWEVEDANGNWVFSEALWNSNLAQADYNDALVEYNGRYYTTNRAYASYEFQGTSLPTVYGSFGTSLSWKGINLGLLFTYSIGGKVYDSLYANIMGCSPSTNYERTFHTDNLKAWQAVPAGMTEDSPNRIDPNGIPQLNAAYTSYDNGASSRWLTNGSWLVFKNLNVNYDFPRKWVSAMKLQGLNLGCSIENLFTVTARKGINPQYNYGGGQGENFVQSRVFNFSLTARF